MPKTVQIKGLQPVPPHISLGSRGNYQAGSKREEAELGSSLFGGCVVRIVSLTRTRPSQSIKTHGVTSASSYIYLHTARTLLPAESPRTLEG